MKTSAQALVFLCSFSLKSHVVMATICHVAAILIKELAMIADTSIKLATFVANQDTTQYLQK
ncbi:MAG: hypothetical protein AAGJ78_10435 [Pseudomonadota bacterium]